MTRINKQARRILAAGAFALAAAAAPLAVSVMDPAPAQDVAAPKCLAHFGNIEDGKCLGRSNGNGVNVGTPSFGLNGPDGAGVNVGPMLPGTTISQGVN